MTPTSFGVHCRTMPQPGQGFEQTLLAFALLLEKHIRREESDLFERLQHDVPEDVLLRAGRKLSA